MSNHARKMLEWGDKCVGFQQQHEVAGWVQPTAAVRFYLGAPDHVEVAFSTTVTFGGGVQHSADGSIVLSRAHASELGAALLDLDATMCRIRDQILDKSRSGVKIAAAEIAEHLADGAGESVGGYQNWHAERERANPGGWSAPSPERYVATVGYGAQLVERERKLREILETRPGEGAALRDWENWSRVAGKLMEGLK
jgi:hypothetical protein